MGSRTPHARLARLAVAALAVGVYLVTLRAGFVYDDEIAVQRQEVVRQGDFAKIFTTPYHAGTGGAGGTGLYRPLTVGSFVAQQAVFGPEPASFHAVNVALHAAVSVLVLDLALALTLPLGGALAAGALFAAHPVHTEAVAGISGRADLLSTLFFLIALLAFIRLRRPDGEPSARGLIATSLAFLAAMACKESTVVFPVVAVAYAALFASPPTSRRAALRLAAWFCLPLAIYAAVRIAVLGDPFVPAASMTIVENPLAGLGWAYRAMNAVGLGARYVRLLVFPDRLSPDWGHAEIVAVESPLDPHVLAGIAALAAVAALLVITRRRAPAIAFCLVFGLATWFIVSNVAVVIGVGMAERLLYLPSVSFCLLIGIAWDRLALGGRRRPATVLGLVVLAAASARTVSAASRWHDEYTLFSAAERAAPRSIKVLGNLGVELVRRGRIDEARARFERAASLAPEHVPTAINLSGVLLKTGDLDGAERIVRRVLSREPGNAVALAQLGVVLRRRGALEQARDVLTRAIAADPSMAGPRLDLAAVLITLGELARARHELEALLARDPESARALHGLGVVAMVAGRLDEAARLLRRAAALAPDDPAIAGDLQRVLDRSRASPEVVAPGTDPPTERP